MRVMGRAQENSMKMMYIRCLAALIASITWTITAAQAEIKIGIAGPLSGSTAIG